MSFYDMAGYSFGFAALFIFLVMALCNGPSGGDWHRPCVRVSHRIGKRMGHSKTRVRL